MAPPVVSEMTGREIITNSLSLCHGLSLCYRTTWPVPWGRCGQSVRCVRRAGFDVRTKEIRPYHPGRSRGCRGGPAREDVDVQEAPANRHLDRRGRLPRAQRRHPRGRQGSHRWRPGGHRHRGRLSRAHREPPSQAHLRGRQRHPHSRRDDPRLVQQGQSRRLSRPGGRPVGRPRHPGPRPADLPPAPPRRRRRHRRRRHDERGRRPGQEGPGDRRRAQDHRQRPVGDRGHVRSRHGRHDGGRGPGQGPHHRLQPPPGDGGRADGPLRRLAGAARGRRRRGRRDPHPGDPVRPRQGDGPVREPQQEGQGLHDRRGRGGRRARRRRSVRRPRGRDLAGPGPPRRRGEVRGRGSPEAQRPGQSVHRPRPRPARRHAHAVRPPAGHAVRLPGVRAAGRAAVRAAGRSAQRQDRFGAHRERRRQSPHRAAGLSARSRGAGHRPGGGPAGRRTDS